MADFKKDAAPIEGAWADTPQSRREYDRRTIAKGATPEERARTERVRRVTEAAERRAQRRGVAHGYDQADWDAAEKEIEAEGTREHWDQNCR